MKPGYVIFAVLLLFIGGCERAAPPRAASASATASATASASLQRPAAALSTVAASSPADPGLAVRGGIDVGRVERVPVTATGSGESASAAIHEATMLAIMQVNGTTVKREAVSFNARGKALVDLTTEQGDWARVHASFQSRAFAERVAAQSDGVVTSFQVLKLTPPIARDGPFTAEISAEVARFAPPADNRIKIVVAPLRSAHKWFQIGGQQLSAEPVLAQLRQKLVDALTQSGRFIVLDREFDAELEEELDRIANGQAGSRNQARLGREFAADLVWTGVVNSIGYHRHARQLRTIDREVVSYSGGWSLSQRLINLTTRQLVHSATLQGAAPSRGPTTMDGGINAYGTLGALREEMARRSLEAILLHSFPVSVVERNGAEVVLSQGGSALVEGRRYRAYLQGKQMRDPQTGQSLGSVEQACCDVLVRRVTPKLSYGVLENITVALDGTAPGDLLLRETVAKADLSQAATPAAPGAAKPRRAPGRTEPPAPRAPEADKENDW